MAADSGNAGGATSSQDHGTGNSGQTATPDKTMSGSTTTQPTAEEFAALKTQLEHTLQVHAEMKTKFQARDDADKKAAEDALAKQGEFKTLYESAKVELDKIKPELERLKGVVGKILEGELKAIPEKDRDVIPEGDAISKLDWIAKAKEKGFFGSGTVQKQTGRGDGSPLPKDNKPTGLALIFKK
jgi:hypothetical protein